MPAPETTAPPEMPQFELAEVAAAQVQGPPLDRSNAIPTWRSSITALLERNKRYPADAAQRSRHRAGRFQHRPQGPRDVEPHRHDLRFGGARPRGARDGPALAAVPAAAARAAGRRKSALRRAGALQYAMSALAVWRAQKLNVLDARNVRGAPTDDDTVATSRSGSSRILLNTFSTAKRTVDRLAVPG